MQRVIVASDFTKQLGTQYAINIVQSQKSLDHRLEESLIFCRSFSCQPLLALFLDLVSFVVQLPNVFRDAVIFAIIFQMKFVIVACPQGFGNRFATAFYPAIHFAFCALYLSEQSITREYIVVPPHSHQQQGQLLIVCHIAIGIELCHSGF